MFDAVRVYNKQMHYFLFARDQYISSSGSSLVGTDQELFDLCEPFINMAWSYSGEWIEFHTRMDLIYVERN